jgi:lipoprotein-anchoring transpeptidase ErfK/SrfK
MRVISRASIHRSFVDRSLSVFIVLVSVLLTISLFSIPAQAESLPPSDPVLAANNGDPTQVADSAVTGDVAAVDASRSGKWIEVNLAQQRLYAWQNGSVVMSSAISSGIAAYPTRRGTFKIRVKYRATRMRGPGYNLPGVPWTMYYSGSFAIHGAYWHHNFGHPMSHGCINLPVAFAGRLYAWAPVGTTVVIH